MFVYLPIWDQDAANPDKQRLLSIENQAPGILKVLEEEKAQPEDENNNGFNGFGGGARRRRNYYNDDDNKKDLLTGYFQKEGFEPLLSWSHNVSGIGASLRYRSYTRAYTGEVSISRWSDKHTPLLYVSSLRGEIFPFVYMRSVNDQKEGVIRVFEYEFRNCAISNFSVNGSSGDRHTESMSLSFLSFFARYIDIDTKTGEISTLMSGYWDEETESGSRDGPQHLPSLSVLCRRTVSNNFHLYDKKDLLLLVKLKIFSREEITVDLSAAYLPVRGRRLAVADEKDLVHYKEIHLKTLDMASLKKAIATKYKVEPSSIDKLYIANAHKRLIEIEEDAQVEDLTDDSSIVAAFK